jgi:hypothetical protein
LKTVLKILAFILGHKPIINPVILYVTHLGHSLNLAASFFSFFQVSFVYFLL